MGGLRIKLLVHTAHAQNFARVLNRIRPAAMVDTAQLSEMDPGTLIALKLPSSVRTPFQWYNFFDYWQSPRPDEKAAT